MRLVVRVGGVDDDIEKAPMLEAEIPTATYDAKVLDLMAMGLLYDNDYAKDADLVWERWVVE